MKSTLGSNFFRILILCVVLVSVSRAASLAAECSDWACTPGEATSNSIYEFSFTFRDDPTDRGPLPPRSIELYIDGLLAASYDSAGCAKYYDGTSLRVGIKYAFRLSAGLDLEESAFGPNALWTSTGAKDMTYKRIIRCCGPDSPPSRQPELKANADGTARTHRWAIIVAWQGPPDDSGNPPAVQYFTSGNRSGPIVHDSFFRSASPRVNRYGGYSGDRDYLVTFASGYPWSWYCDPLSVTPYEVQFPDEGSSTSTYTFRTHYDSIDGLSPKPWVRHQEDAWSTTSHECGVMLYLRNLDRMDPASPMYDAYWGVFRGHHMYKENPGASGVDTDYILRVIGTSTNMIRRGADHWRTTMGWTSSTNRLYEALPPGRYEYFFACSDDDFSALGGDKDMIWPYLDDSPALPTPPAPNDRLFGMGINYPVSTNGMRGYVSKRTYMPGGWMNLYPYDSWVGSSFDPSKTNINQWPILYKAYSYPQVDPGLYQIGSNFGLTGGARFLGTLSPYKRSVIPSVPYQSGDLMWRLWSETAGGTEQDQFTFRVTYWQSQGVAPSYVRLFLKNSWNPEDTTVPWRSYDMLPTVSSPTVTQYKTGVIYEYRLSGGQLGRGPHCYYFETSDQNWTDTRYYSQNGTTKTVGSRVCRYPRRPDTLGYDGTTFYDAFLPGRPPSPSPDYPPEGEMVSENDIINGPYINTKPELVPGSWSVTPSTGVAGTEFVFRVRYRDADNQRPYTPLAIIEMDDAGNTFTASMVRSPESSVPGNSAAQYSDVNGVAYEFRSSSSPGLRLQAGNRQYRFEFTDDWGRQTNQDDRIAGEMIAAIDTGWKGGFVVFGNRVPTLSQGTVLSADGTSNEATVWNYNVTYTDLDNNPPTYILALIGRQDTPGGPIIWDSGNAMKPTNDADTVYSDGKLYGFSTRLAGSNTQPVKYYHCFVASDGIEPAEYNAVTSPSSGMIWKTAETLTKVGASTVTYSFANKPLVTDLPPSSPLLLPTNYTTPLVYAAGVLQTAGVDYNLSGTTGVLTFIVPPGLPVTSKYWFGTEPDAVRGPAAVTGNTPPVLYDGKVIPLKGQSTTVFTYSVTYKDLDNQAPLYVNAVIDDVRYPMVNWRASTTYRSGVEYRCTATLTTGTHQFYFEASDGANLVLFDNNLANTTVDPIPGPYINDRPTFSGAQISPNVSIDQGQPVTYTVTYTDKDGDIPSAGYPVVYVDNPDETEWIGSVDAKDTDFIMDTTQNWITDQFKGMPVEVTIAASQSRIIYKISSNTQNRLYLVATDVVDVVPIGSTYSIGKLLMDRQDPSDQIYTDGVVYEAKVPSLGVGTHKAHFKAVVSEQTEPGVFETYTLRAPISGDLSGPTVVTTQPPTNKPPTLTNGGVTPRTGTSGTAFRFAVTYKDENGDDPRYAHDGVPAGGIKLVLEESPGVFVAHDLTTDLSAPNYTTGVEFSVVLSGLTLGPHRYYFQASDGWVSATLPTPPSYYTVYVSRPPVLTQGAVIPVSGNTGRVYEYKVKYQDPDNDPPAYIRLFIDGNAPIEIGVPVPGADYINGVVYSYPLLKGTLDERLHTFYFEATDGNGYAWYDQDVRDQEDAANPDPRKNSTTSAPPSVIRPIDGPSVHSNDPPTLSNGSVSPATGFDLDTYIYKVTYKDPNGDEPEFVECYIDDPDPQNPISLRAYRMTKNPAQDDFTVGVDYTLAKVGLAAGSHKFYFRASDWLRTVVLPTTTPMDGPTVSTRSSATVTISVPASIAIGASATITGTVTGYLGVPLVSVPVVLRILKPDGTLVTPQPTVTTNSSGVFTYPAGATSWKPPLTGNWKIQASWAGNTKYLLSVSPERTMSVLGPSYTVNGLDMISIPIQPLSTFPDGALGPVPAFALAKWLPTKLDYKLYSLLPGIRTDYDFPGIAPGQSYWIKTLVSKTIAPTGSLIDPYSDYVVTLGVGWNQVGCPFTVEVPWSNLRVRRTINGVTSEVSLATAAGNGWIKEYGWTYDTGLRNYKLVDATRSGAERAMRPWRGYWMKANMYCQLVIPGPNKSIAGGSRSYTTSSDDAGSSNVPSNVKWQVQLIAKIGDAKDEANYFGVSRSKDERMESPACFQDYVDLYFTDDKGRAYASDLKSKIADGGSWRFNVATDKAGEVELTWDGLGDVPDGVRLILLDHEGKSAVLTSGGSYKFVVGDDGAPRSFEILFEKK